VTAATLPPAAEAALGYARRGWAPIPLPPRTKNPNRPGWQRERWTEDEIRAQAAKFGNVGVILGQPSGNLTDIDLDCPEAIALAPHILPPTGAVFGHADEHRAERLERLGHLQAAGIERTQPETRDEG